MDSNRMGGKRSCRNVLSLGQRVVNEAAGVRKAPESVTKTLPFRKIGRGDLLASSARVKKHS